MKDADDMLPGEKHYIALAKVVTEMDNLKEFFRNLVDEHHSQNMREHDSIITKLDNFNADMAMCPHVKLEETERQIGAIWGWLKVMIVAVCTTLTSIVVAVVIAVVKHFI